MPHTLLLKNADYVVSCDNTDSLHKNVNLLCEDGHIVYIGPQQQTADEVLDARGMVIYPGFGATTAQGLYNLCTPISRADLMPGDLVLFTGTYNAGRPVTHCSIYVGNGQMIHAGDPVQYASIDAAYWQEHLYSYGRLPA